MSTTYQIHVFGKAGCDKCHALHQRLDALLQDPEWADFEKVPHDLDTVDGLVAFCEAECINPQRIPAFYVAKFNPAAGRFEPLPNPRPGAAETPGGTSALYSLVGLQTDYSSAGRGLLTPRMIEAVLRQARGL